MSVFTRKPEFAQTVSVLSVIAFKPFVLAYNRVSNNNPSTFYASRKDGGGGALAKRSGGKGGGM